MRPLRKQLTRIAYVFSSLKFITCEHPNLNPSSSHFCDALWYLILELIFKGSCPNYLKIFFNGSNQSVHFLFFLIGILFNIELYLVVL